MEIPLPCHGRRHRLRLSREPGLRDYRDRSCLIGETEDASDDEYRESEEAFALPLFPTTARLGSDGVHHQQLYKDPSARSAEFRRIEPVGKKETINFRIRNKPQFFIDKLAQGIATLAAAFYPKEVILRPSDFNQ